MATILEPTSETSRPTESFSQPQETTTARRKPKKKTWAGKLGRSALMTVRRIHLYSGIFMFPWVLLYGFTGWFFNHPRLFTADQVTTFAAADLSGDVLTELPTATETAQAVVDEMNLESFMIGGPEIKLLPDRTPRYRGFLSYSVNTEDATHQVTINPVTGSGEVRTTYVVPQDKSSAESKINPLANVRRIPMPAGGLTQIQSGVPGILKQLELPAGEAFSGRRSASLVFAAEADGVPCLVTYNVADGQITSVREDDRPTMDSKTFLQRLHLARMYSPDWDVRWLWALLVDAMFVSMVFWGVSGLMMWWQVKRTRVLGGGVLVASIVFAALMAINMHDSMTTGAGRGGNRGGGRNGHAEAKTEDSIASPSLAIR